MFLTDLALGHQIHEGWFAGSVSQRNNNPGNLRLTPFEMSAYGAVAGDNDFARFPSYAIGFQALENDVKAKICGQSSHIDYSTNPTFLDYVRVYAPTDDGNDPNGYCQSLCRSLSQYNLTPQTPLTTLAALIHSDEAPATVPQDPATQLKIAEEAVNRVGGLRKFALQRLIVRLKTILGVVS